MIRADVTLVRVDAQAIDGKKPIAGLTKDDFLVFDEGARQPIGYFGRDTEPIHLALLLDVSGSMKQYLARMAVAARQALRPLAPSDEVAIVFFGRIIRIAQPLTSDFDEAAVVVREALMESRVGAGTAINPSIAETANYLRNEARNKPGRRAIVILTDNKGLNYQLATETVLKTLYEADAVLNAIVTPNAKPPVPDRPGAYVNPDFSPSDVFKLARESGGEVLAGEKTGETLTQMIERIRVRYSIHYSAPGGEAGSVRRVRVELSPEARKRFPRAEIRARSGYIVPR